MAFLDTNGLERLWQHIVAKIGTKADASDIVELQAEIDELDSHTNNTSNPHNVTASQVGAYTKSEADAKIAGLKDSMTNGSITVKEASHAANADSAENADKADYATEAGNANYAASAGNANIAASATKATQDGNGKVISDTYETKTDASSKLDTAKAYTDKKIAALDEIVDLKADIADFNESIIALSVSGTTVTYVKGDGTTHTFETQDTDTTYSLATDETTGLTKLYATTGSAEDGTMTQKAIKTELDKKVGVTIDASQNALVFTK